jgi:hypothetical protein
MQTCPKGHESEADDYCDVCGARIAGAAPAAAPGRHRPEPVGGAAAARACPACGAALDGRFCEECGQDSLATVSGAAPTTPDGPAGSVAGPPVPVEEPAAGSSGAAARVAADAPADAPRDGDSGVAVGSWEIVVTADREYFERMQALRGPDAGAVEFPRFFPERRFPLAGSQVLIGRRSRSRGIHPEIDLTGPPEDAAVSHLHALLVPLAEGGWAAVDLKSTNYTYLNGSPRAIDPETPVPLRPGDYVNVGAFTRLTLRPAG